MKQVFGILLFLTLTAVVGKAQDGAFYKALFWKQMSATCRPGLRWEKSVTEFAEDGSPKTETKVFELDCLHGSATAGETRIALNPEEFGHLFEYMFDNPYHSENLDVQRKGASVFAIVNASEDSKLRLQQFEVDEATGVLRTAEANIVKDSPLYDLDVRIVVHFDEQGHYMDHLIETITDVLMGGALHTRIQARML
ncbi:MAG: hypothetical protein RLZZ519_1845 [Bacteroidota bacterium]|jgi:hypothetical protein